jgi:hypothetical protein
MVDQAVTLLEDALNRGGQAFPLLRLEQAMFQPDVLHEPFHLWCVGVCDYWHVGLDGE